MSAFNLSYKRFGEHAILIEWPSRIEPDILNDILDFKAKILQSYLSVHCVHAYQSLTLFFEKSIQFDSIVKRLKELYRLSSSQRRDSNQLTIPVCYQPEYANDLINYCDEVNLSIDEVIHIHTQKEYLVYFIGFLPGFLYLGGLSEKLFLPRKENPSKELLAGSVAIGGEQTGIYPQTSPGGWHVIGRTPLSLFAPDADPICPVVAGDYVRFVSINHDEYQHYEKELKQGASLVSLGLIEKIG